MNNILKIFAIILVITNLISCGLKKPYNSPLIHKSIKIELHFLKKYMK